MGLILWIDQNTVAASLVEKVFKKKDRPFYRLDNARDFSYLVEDLKPQAIVLDQATAHQDEAQFKTQYLSSRLMQETPFIVIGDWVGLDFIHSKMGSIERRMDPFEIPQKLRHLLGETH